MAGTEVTVGVVSNLVGTNYTNYVFGDPYLAGLFLIGIFLFFMIKAGVSVDSALVIFIMLLLTLVGTQLLPSLALWIIIFAIATILFAALIRLGG